MKRFIQFIISAAFLFTIYGNEMVKDTELTDTAKPEIIAGLYMGGGKLFNSDAQNNLEWLYGDIYLGMEYEYKHLSGTVVIAIFPEGLGPPPHFNFELSPDNPLQKSKGNAADVNVWDAHIRIHTEIIDIQFGRWMLSKGIGRFYGFYSGTPYKAVGWWSNGSMRNQFELSKTVRGFHTAFSISPDDKKFKKGTIHALFRHSFKDFLNVSYSYGANVFDRISHVEALVNNNIDICIDAAPVPKLKDFKIFFDMGFVDITDKDHIKVKRPISFGFTIPTNNVMNLVQVEMEVLKDRKWIDHDQKVKDAPFLFGIHFNKEFLNHFNFEGALYADGSPENITVEIGLDSWF